MGKFIVSNLFLSFLSIKFKNTSTLLYNIFNNSCVGLFEKLFISFFKKINNFDEVTCLVFCSNFNNKEDASLLNFDILASSIPLFLYEFNKYCNVNNFPL